MVTTSHTISGRLELIPSLSHNLQEFDTIITFLDVAYSGTSLLRRDKRDKKGIENREIDNFSFAQNLSEDYSSRQSGKLLLKNSS